MAPFQRLTAGVAGAIARRLATATSILVGIQAENEQLAGAPPRARAAGRRTSGEMELMNRRLKRLLALERELPTQAVAARGHGARRERVVPEPDPQQGRARRHPDRHAGDRARGRRRSDLEHEPARVARAAAHRPQQRHRRARPAHAGCAASSSGLLEQGTTLKYVKRSDDVRVGDRVVASGLDGVFPKGLPVGRVTKVSRKDRGLFLYAEVTPDADASRLEEVLVALPSGEELRRPAALATRGRHRAARSRGARALRPAGARGRAASGTRTRMSLLQTTHAPAPSIGAELRAAGIYVADRDARAAAADDGPARPHRRPHHSRPGPDPLRLPRAPRAQHRRRDRAPSCSAISSTVSRAVSSGCTLSR